MERGDWDNDGEYPRAPLPAHERTWRHPSELGSGQWGEAEPPLIMGRGLSVATGTVGAVLALGLLWLMVPHAGRGAGVAVEISATSVRVSPPALTPQTSRELSVNTAPTLTVMGSDTTAISAASSIAMTTVADILSAPTSAVASVSPAPPVPTMVLGGGEVSDAIPPVAVALMPGHYVVTTAAAVRGREGFAVQLPSGETVVGAVVSVDVANGTAVLSVTTEVDDTTITAITAGQSDLSAGGFIVMAPEAIPAHLWVDDDGTKVGYDNGGGGAEAGEGSLVLDADGYLMGMCTKSGSGVQLVTVATLLDALVSASTSGTPAWLGIEADLDGSGLVTVTKVLDGGPAAAAGLLVGDVIVGINGEPVTDLETLRTVIGAHAAGETVTLTIQRPPADPATTALTGPTATAGITGTTLVPGTSTSSAGTSTSSGNTTSTASATTSVTTIATTTSSPATSPAPTTNPTNTTIDVAVTLSQQPGSL